MRGLMRMALAVALGAGAMTGTVRADSALKAMLTGSDSRGFEAVGRIEFGHRSFCTGSLIASDLVLTAAHCLYDPDTGQPFAASEIQFLAGWRNGRATATRSVLRAMAHPDYADEPDKSLRIAHDLALLQLDQPVSNGGVHPFAIEAKPRKGASVGVVSYAWDRAEAPSLQDLCQVLARQSGVLVLSCDIDFGSSGSPVFVFENGVPHIVSVISAKAEADGRKVALGTDLETPLAELKNLMQAAGDTKPTTEPRVRRLQVGNGGPATGAKFLRP